MCDGSKRRGEDSFENEKALHDVIIDLCSWSYDSIRLNMKVPQIVSCLMSSDKRFDRKEEKIEIVLVKYLIDRAKS